jgi:hypothetical protein
MLVLEMDSFQLTNQKSKSITYVTIAETNWLSVKVDTKTPQAKKEVLIKRRPK